MTYDRDDVARLGNYSGASLAEAFKTLAGVATDPTSVTLTVRQPDGAELVYAWPTPGLLQSALTRESAGRFYADVPLTQSGLWTYTLVGIGTVAAAGSGRFIVRSSEAR